MLIVRKEAKKYGMKKLEGEYYEGESVLVEDISSMAKVYGRVRR